MRRLDIRRLSQRQEILAGDHTHLRELLHGPNEGMPLRYSLAWASLPVGARSLPHRLKESSEVYYFLHGQGRMHVGSEEASVTAGDTVLVPPGATQWLVNEGGCPLEFLCIVDPGWRADDEEV